jgi:type II secretory pathway pseudopilin PulG
MVVVGIIGILAAVAIPQYSRYRKDVCNKAALSAAHTVAIAEEAYFIVANDYTSDYAMLISVAGLRIDYNVLYGPISISYTYNPPIYAFSFNHVTEDSQTYTFSNEHSIQVQPVGSRILANDPTIPPRP